MQTTVDTATLRADLAYRGSTLLVGAIGVVLFALAAIPRFWRLSEQLFIQSDDAFHILLVRRFAQDNILDWSQARPMYPYILGSIARLLDDSAFFPAQVSALCGALLVGVIFFWARARFGLLAAVGAGVTLAVSQLEIYFSKVSGPIAPAMLVVTLR